ncbi:MAG: hypothetical protein ACMG57_02195 [Candidatus Dojkabacteria bacterium]
MGNPLAQVNPEDTPVENTNPVPEIKPVEAITPPVVLPTPIQPVTHEMNTKIEPIHVDPHTKLTDSLNSSAEFRSNKVNKNGILLILIILALVIFIALVSLLISRNTPIAVNDLPVDHPDSTIVSTPKGPVQKDFGGKLYNLSFKYTSELGTANSTTTKFTYPIAAGGGDCNMENISFSGDRDLSIGVSTGHCEGGSAPTTNYTKITSKDGKSFFMIIKKLDETLFPGMYTITVSGGVDSSDTYVAGVTGVHIDAIRVKDVDKYTKYIQDIINSMTVELSPLKSENFDIVTSI